MDNIKLFVRGVNLALRLSTLGAKLILTIIISLYYSVEELGQFGIFSSTILYTVFFLGFDVYISSGRQIASERRPSNLLSVHFNFIFISSLFLMPISFVLNFFDVLGNEMALLFYFIALGELLGNEIYRMLVFLNRQIIASTILFIKSGLWIYLFSGWVFWSKDELDDSHIYWLWFLFSFIGSALGFIVIEKLHGLNQSLLFALSPLPLYTKMAFKSVYFFLSSSSYRLIYVIDKYMILYIGSLEMVGVYTFYSTIVSSISSIVDSSIASLHYPNLIKYFGRGEFEKYNLERRMFIKSLVIMISCLVVIYSVGIWGVIPIVGKDYYSSHITIFYVLLAGMYALSIGTIFHYDLYVRNAEKYIAKASFIGFFFFLISVWILRNIGMLAIPFAISIGFMITSGFKYYYSIKFRNG